MPPPSSPSTAAEPSRRVLLGMTWADGSALVRIRDDDEPTSTLLPAAGLRLGYRAQPSSARRCVGHVPFRKAQGDYFDCSNTPQPGSRTCERCSIVEATFASNLHHAHTRGRAELDPAILDHLRQPNELYLAAFRDGSIKVGTTTAARRNKRLAEQGAWRARIVASSTDGFAVRDIEDRVTTEYDLPQSVAIGRKLDGMVTPKADDALAAQLDRHALEVGDLVERMDDIRLEAASVDWCSPSGTDTTWSSVHKYPLKLESGNHDLEVLSACGRLVAIRRPGGGDIFVADLGRLYGIELEIGDFGSDELAVQDALF